MVGLAVEPRIATGRSAPIWRWTTRAVGSATTLRVVKNRILMRRKPRGATSSIGRDEGSPQSSRSEAAIRQDRVVPYPPRPQLKPLPEFAGQTHPGTRATKRLIEFVLAQYAAGLSLREIAELTDRTHSAVRNILDRAGVPRRPTGARRQHDHSGASSAIPIRLPVVDATHLILLVAGLCVFVAMPSSRIDLDRLERAARAWGNLPGRGPGTPRPPNADPISIGGERPANRDASGWSEDPSALLPSSGA